MKKLFFCLLIIPILLIGCGTKVTQGTILSHKYTPAHSESYFNYYAFPYPCGTKKSPRTCYMGAEQQRYIADDYELYIKDCHDDTSKCFESWVEVDSRTYNTYQDGQNIVFN